MKLLITYKKGAKLTLNFTKEEYAQEYLHNKRNEIKCYEVI